jgi:hypothetical protein
VTPDPITMQQLANQIDALETYCPWCEERGHILRTCADYELFIRSIHREGCKPKFWLLWFWWVVGIVMGLCAEELWGGI